MLSVVSIIESGVHCCKFSLSLQTSLFEAGEGEALEDTSRSSSVSVCDYVYDCVRYLFLSGNVWSRFSPAIVGASQSSHFSKGASRTPDHCGAHVPGTFDCILYPHIVLHASSVGVVTIMLMSAGESLLVVLVCYIHVCEYDMKVRPSLLYTSAAADD